MYEDNVIKINKMSERRNQTQSQLENGKNDSEDQRKKKQPKTEL